MYLQATKLIAASYAIGNNLQTAEESLIISEQFIGSIDFSKMQSIVRVHKNLGSSALDIVKKIAKNKEVMF